jgi:nicotinamidase-related amidase
MMFAPQDSILFVIDVQGRLAGLMHQREMLFNNIQILIRAARLLEIPILWTEQSPAKLGATVPEIVQWFAAEATIPKTSFSCCAEEPFRRALTSIKRRQCILVGTEAHICVYQTAADLVCLRYEVQVVSDAVSSRTPENKQIGLERIRAAGGIITSTEMVLFELLKTAGHEKFKEIAGLVK